VSPPASLHPRKPSNAPSWQGLQCDAGDKGYLPGKYIGHFTAWLVPNSCLPILHDTWLLLIAEFLSFLACIISAHHYFFGWLLSLVD
jgi:hypothetical protein